MNPFLAEVDEYLEKVAVNLDPLKRLAQNPLSMGKSLMGYQTGKAADAMMLAGKQRFDANSGATSNAVGSLMRRAGQRLKSLVSSQ